MTPLRQLREAQGLGLSEVARRADMHRQTLWSLERGLSHLYPGYRRRLAKALKVADDAF